MENKLTHLKEQIQKLGPACAWIEALIQDDDQSWSVYTVHGLEIGISFVSSPSRLILSASIGKPDDTERDSVYASMLCANLLYADQASLRVALTGPNGDLMLISEAQPEEWCVAEIADVLSQFSTVVRNFVDTLNLSTDDLKPAPENSIASLRV